MKPFTVILTCIVLIGCSSPSPSAPDNCKTHCSTGKACGNSCIAKDKKCSQPQGTACDG